MRAGQDADTGPLAAPSWYAATTPDVPAIVMASDGTTVTYAQLDQRSRKFARYLRGKGLRRGDHIAIMLPNSRPFLEVAWAAQRSGLYFTAVNSHLRSGEVQYVLDDCGANALISSGALSEVAGLDFSSIAVRVCTEGELPGFDNYAEILAGQPDAALEDESEGREMLYSSGTTGKPKGIRKPLPDTFFGDPDSVPAQLARGMAFGSSGSGSVFLCPAPLYHSAPLVGAMSWHRLGGTVVVMEKFDARECLELIERHRVTDAQLVPTMFTRLLRLAQADRERYDLSSLRVVTHTAAPCPVPVKKQMIEWWGPIIHEYYSGTEDIGATFISAQEWLERPGSVGKPISPCHIVGPDGTELPAGETGVVYFEGGRSFDYHNDPDKTASVRNESGWRTLGDIGYLDSEGYLYLTDRQAYMIISGGVNIYPQEAENVLAGHPEVLDVAVIGVPDEEMGEAVKAVVQLTDSTRATEDMAARLIAFCRAELASYKCPRTVDFVEEMPRDPNGKLYKRLLRERYWAGHDSRIV